MITITEDLRHGTFIAVTTTEVPDLTPESVAIALAASPYTYSPSPARLAKVAADLMDDGRASHGWSWFTISTGRI
jgi:hypothetical protein